MQQSYNNSVLLVHMPCHAIYIYLCTACALVHQDEATLFCFMLSGKDMRQHETRLFTRRSCF